METTKQNLVLLIEDDPGDARLVMEVLKRTGSHRFELETADTLAAGLSKIAAQPVDVILLDLSLPDSFGVTTIDQVLQQAPTLPIIVLSGAKDEQLALDAVGKGAQDYLVKGEIPGGVLTRSIAYAIERKQAELELSRTLKALKEAYQKILTQQKSVIEEERLKVLLQMAGATSHELNQPLMAILNSIEIMKLDEEVPEKLADHINRIDESGRRIAEIVKKMSVIRQAEIKPDPNGESNINLSQENRFLCLDESDQDFEIFKTHLANQDNIEIFRVASIAEAVRHLKEEKFHLIFLDYMLPDGTGLDFLLWMQREALDTPVIAVTGHGNEVVAADMIKAGAYDYLPKADINQAVLLRCIFQALEKYNLKKEIEKANTMMAQMATRDPLTGLYNRQSMNDMLEKEFSRARRYDTDLACVLMDLDFFKEVNDTYGHNFGDFVLQQFSQRLMKNVRDTDMCFRYGGEEFMILLPNTNVNGAMRTAEKIRQLCEGEIYEDGNKAVNVTVSLGLSTVANMDMASARDLMTFADKALYRAKADGRNRVVAYREDLWTSESGKSFKYLKERLTTILEKTKKSAVESLELMVWDRDGDPYKSHNQQVTQYLKLIGDKLGFNPSIVKTLQHAAIFHDATKVLLAQVDEKKDLSPEERAAIIDHPYKLHELIEPFDFFSEERSVLMWHHEHFDGNGYPDGLKGDEIPYGARIFAIVDALVAMTSHRPYRQSLSGDEIVRELVAQAGAQFDPMLVDIMLDLIKENNLFEVSGEVIAQSKEKLT